MFFRKIDNFKIKLFILLVLFKVMFFNLIMIYIYFVFVNDGIFR